MNIRKIFFALTAIIVVAGAITWGYWFALKKAWIRYNEYDIRSEGILQVGDLAPDLELASLNGESITISSLYQSKPLVLVFGSYT